MTGWIIVLVIFIALSPIAWLRPSARQGGQVGVRLQARRMGLTLHLAPVKWPHWLVTDAPSPCAQYYRVRRSRTPQVWSYWQQSPGQWVNEWREPCVDEALLEHLQPLPADVYKVDANSQVIAAYWGESSAPQTLTLIDTLLKAHA